MVGEPLIIAKALKGFVKSLKPCSKSKQSEFKLQPFRVITVSWKIIISKSNNNNTMDVLTIY